MTEKQSGAEGDPSSLPPRSATNQSYGAWLASTIYHLSGLHFLLTMTTAILERISTLSISGQQLSRLPQLLEDGLPKMPSTVKDDDVPRLLREPYIATGYRPIDQEWRYYFLSLFQKHNEAVNVWTHLIAGFLVLLRFKIFLGTEGPDLSYIAAPLFIFVLASLTYLTCSTLAHLLHSKSELTHYTFYFMDYVGVSAYQYGSALVHFYYSCDQYWYAKVELFFLPGAALLGWLSCVGCCFAKYRYQRPYPVYRKLCQVLPAALAYMLDISPIIHRFTVCQQVSCTEEALQYHVLQMVFFLIGAYFFSCPVPEKYFPGSCDIVGHGHQIFHVFLGLCTLAQLEAVLLDYNHRQEEFLPRHSKAATYLDCSLFFVLVMLSAATAFYLRCKIKKKLVHKDA
ncbi:membrane progestin receptor beta isoform X2 [Ambystoma mexicanum]|uniref:membrane progestin receptor beta isoform X2 n=1 Tax=Ambystoma mexicanum TaxID=8296 RepID=UPI0037E8D5A1